MLLRKKLFIHGILSLKNCVQFLPVFVCLLVALGSLLPGGTDGKASTYNVIGKWCQKELTTDGLFGKAVVNAANILMITGAGGAFGEVLKKVDFKYLIPENIGSIGAFAIVIPLGFSAILKIAQGSSTLAILTSAGAVVPLLEPLGLTSPTMRALTCCAVCCGAMIVSHTNDSYFWVVTKFSGMSVRQGLKLQTIGSLISGLAAAIVLLLFAWGVTG